MLGKRCIGNDVSQGQAFLAWASVEGRLKNCVYWCNIFISTGRLHMILVNRRHHLRYILALIIFSLRTKNDCN